MEEEIVRSRERELSEQRKFSKTLKVVDKKGKAIEKKIEHSRSVRDLKTREALEAKKKKR